MCVCVLWGSMQPSVESKTLATNTVGLVPRGAPQLGVVAHLSTSKKNLVYMYFELLLL